MKNLVPWVMNFRVIACDVEEDSGENCDKNIGLTEEFTTQ